MVGWTYRVVAATVISSTVEAPALRTAATIQTPTSGTMLKTAQVNVNGTCPLNSYVTLNVNDSFNGVAWCSASNSYTITTSVYTGVNTIAVQDYNQTNEAGPTSAPIQVTYTASTAPAAGGLTAPTASNPSQTNNPGSSNTVTTTPVAASPLLLTSNFQFHAFTSQQTFNWQLDLEGGTPPYKVAVTWGDGKTSDLTFPGDPIFTIHHKYSTSGFYPVIVHSVDSVGQLHTTQLAALITNIDGTAPFVHTQATTSGGNSTPAKPIGTASSLPHLSGTVKFLFLAWPSYLIVLLMTISFWLGEKQEFFLLRPYRKQRARR